MAWKNVEGMNLCLARQIATTEYAQQIRPHLLKVCVCVWGGGPKHNN